MWLRKASRRISQVYDQYLEPLGLTVNQYGLMSHLAGYPGISIGALAERMIVDPTTLTRNLRPLERRGLVCFAPDPQDRRSRKLNLTEEGRATLAAAKPAWTEAQRHIEASVGADEVPALHAALDHLLERLAP
jgi:DNA-binding MarR family transcriptional regulator